MESQKEESEKELQGEEEQALVLNTTKVVEYLHPFMSLELLCKFPDNSAYDFDYSQSSIWSPLIRRPYNSPIDFDSDYDLIIPKKKKKKKLNYDMGLGARCSLKKLVGSKLNKHKNKKMGSDLPPTPPRIKGSCCNPIFDKPWAMALKAASKQFKRWKKVKKRDPIAHVMLPKSL